MNTMNTAILMLCITSTAGCSYPLSDHDRTTYVDAARQRGQDTLGDARLRQLLTAMDAAAFDHQSDPPSHASDSGADVLARLDAVQWDVDVACKMSTNGATWAWDGGGETVYLRCGWFDKQSIAAWSGSLVHELAHHAGYRHDGNRREGNQCTVPHLVTDAFILIAEGPAAQLPDDACSALASAYERMQ